MAPSKGGEGGRFSAKLSNFVIQIRNERGQLTDAHFYTHAYVFGEHFELFSATGRPFQEMVADDARAGTSARPSAVQRTLELFPEEQKGKGQEVPKAQETLSSSKASKSGLTAKTAKERKNGISQKATKSGNVASPRPKHPKRRVKRRNVLHDDDGSK